MKIADISHYQGSIDWSLARKELELVIFRASAGKNIDKKYLYNTAMCGIPYGAYHYVTAGTPESARKEAQFFVQCTNKANKKPLFYIADIEYKAQNAETTEGVCKAFLSELHNLGCKKIGLYINTRYNWAKSAIKMADIMWIPHWGLNDGKIPADIYKPKHYNDLWQYTSKGRVNGINGDVDLSIPNGNKPYDWFVEGWDYSEIKLGSRVLNVGCMGDDVKKLQKLLNTFFSFALTIDGEYGSKTRTGVKKLQQYCGLSITGTYDKLTHEAFVKLINGETTPKLIITKETVCYCGDNYTSPQLTYLSENKKVEPICDKDKNYLISANGWYAIKYNNQIGWVDGKYIKEE